MYTNIFSGILDYTQIYKLRKNFNPKKLQFWSLIGNRNSNYIIEKEFKHSRDYILNDRQIDFNRIYEYHPYILEYGKFLYLIKQKTIDKKIKKFKIDWEHPDTIDWNKILKNMYTIDWNEISKNPTAMHILEQNKDKINWFKLSENPTAINILEQNKDKINWSWLSANPAAIYLLENNPDKIDWMNLSSNPAAIRLLEQHKDRINTFTLLSNEKAVDLIFEFIDKYTIDDHFWVRISLNPGIFELRYLF